MRGGTREAQPHFALWQPTRGIRANLLPIRLSRQGPDHSSEFYHTFTTGYMPDKTDEYERLRERLNRQSPVDCHGSAGDVLFWHHRLGHMAGHNYSARIRQAVLYDFQRTDLEEKQGLPPPRDMWRDWSKELREVEL